MISPSSDEGIAARWICLTATVSPVIQFKPRKTAPNAPLPKQSPRCCRTSPLNQQQCSSSTRGDWLATADDSRNVRHGRCSAAASRDYSPSPCLVSPSSLSFFLTFFGRPCLPVSLSSVYFQPPLSASASPSLRRLRASLEAAAQPVGTDAAASRSGLSAAELRSVRHTRQTYAHTLTRTTGRARKSAGELSSGCSVVSLLIGERKAQKFKTKRVGRARVVSPACQARTHCAND